MGDGNAEKFGNVQRVLIFGWGKTGNSLAGLLLKLGKEVMVTETCSEDKFEHDSIEYFTQHGVLFEFGGHTREFCLNSGVDLIVVSPGIDISCGDVFEILNKSDKPCIGEIEFCYNLTDADIIAVTGTNGKTTVTTLIYEVFNRYYKDGDVYVGGNIGVPFSEFVLNTKKGDVVVLEISSFQLETIVSFKPKVAVLTNLQPDHLDRYKTCDEYYEAKMNIFSYQEHQDYAVLPCGGLSEKVSKQLKPKVLCFDTIKGNNNFECLCVVSQIYNITREECLSVFEGFNGIEHRMEFVRSVRGVFFINDSKATNVSATVWGLSALASDRRYKDSRVILIAGGKDKGTGYNDVLDLLSKVKKINLIGQSSEKIKICCHPYVACQIHQTFAEAVLQSFQDAQPNDIVLLSPMCSSFDMFSNYQERGNVYKSIVARL